MTLTHLAIQNAKPARKPYKLSDGGALYILVEPAGAKRWRMNYRFGNRQRTLHIGPWPDISLADARRRRDSARDIIAAGRDPAQEAKLEKLAQQIAAATTFKAVAEEWFEKCRMEGRAQVTLDKVRWLLGMAYPLLAHRPIADVTAQEVLIALRKVEATGRYESARRMRSVFSRVFRYAIATARAERDVAADLRGAIIPPKVTHLAAITKPDEAGRLLRAISCYQGHAITAIALQIAPHVFVRPGELRAAEWLEFDAGEEVWEIPPERMKMRRPHSVPLSRQVVALLHQLHDLTGHGRFLFPSFRSPDRCMSENTLNAALRTLGYDKSEMTSHGFRAMADTLLNELGEWHPDAIERQLAHVDKNTVRRAYVRGEYWNDRVRMMQRWSDYLDELRANMPAQKQSFGRDGRPGFGTFATAR